MKAILLCGGTGSRLYPLTESVNKHLLPIYDKPMVYYPLTMLLASKIKDIFLISSPHHISSFEMLLGNGRQWGLNISYGVQETAGGIAQAFEIAEKFIGNGPVALALGDNIFSGSSAFSESVKNFQSGARIFACHSIKPQHYGVIVFDGSGKPIEIEEKPKNPRSNYVIPGFYIYDNDVVAVAKNLKPSMRGEIEISDVNKHYLAIGKLHVEILSRGFAWMDAGTTDTLHGASSYVEIIESRSGMKIGSPEEAAYNKGLINRAQLIRLIEKMPKSEYRIYLSELLNEQ